VQESRASVSGVGPANEEVAVAEPAVDSVDVAVESSASDGAVIETQAVETQIVEPEVVDVEVVEPQPGEVPERSADVAEEGPAVLEDAVKADDDSAVVEEGREDS
jgi:hypothetical protein